MDLVRKIFEVEPEKRIGIKGILEHAWLSNVSNDNICLFTKAERILLDKNKINYNACKNGDFEIFDVKNLGTGENEMFLKNNRTKSVILAPFNSSVESGDSKSNEFYDVNNKKIKLENNILKFAVKVKEINYNYELNNNGEIDNGIIISPNESKNSSKKILSPLIIENSNKNSVKNIFKSNSDKKFFKFENNEIDEIKEEINFSAIKELEKFGYNKNFIKNCIKINENNYATTGYYLLVKYSNQNSN